MKYSRLIAEKLPLFGPVLNVHYDTSGSFVPWAAGFYVGSVDHAGILMPCKSSQSSPGSVNQLNVNLQITNVCKIF